MARHGENIRKRNDGRWEARYICGYKEDGKAKYKYIYGKTYAAVRDKKNELMAQKYTQNINPTKTRITFGQLLNDWLIEIQPNVKESTWSRYYFLIEKHIKPDLGSILLMNLSNEDISRFTQSKLKNGSLQGKGGLAPKTVACQLSIIKLALDFGNEKNYYCPDNIKIKNPKQIVPEIQILTMEEQRKLEQYLLANPEPVSLGIMISLYTGLRIGEICALRWEDFDFENGTVYIQRTIMRIQDSTQSACKKTKIIISRPKTECSNRIIPLPAFLLDFLKSFKHNESDYVLTNNCSYLEPRNYYLKYKRILEKCELQKFNYHALRHTFATRCVENDFDLKSLSEILGHADVTITLQRYVHPSLKLKRQHMDKLQEISILSQNSGQMHAEISEF